MKTQMLPFFFSATNRCAVLAASILLFVVLFGAHVLAAPLPPVQDPATGAYKWGDDNHDEVIEITISPDLNVLKFKWTKKSADDKHVEHDGYGEFKTEPRPAHTPAETHKFLRPKDATIADYERKLLDSQGNPTAEIIEVTSANHGLMQPWDIRPLDEAAFANAWMLPYLGLESVAQGGTIYAAINLPLYFASNPLGPLNGSYQVGQTLDQLALSIVGGRLGNVDGLYFATSPLVFDPNSQTSWMPLDGPASWLDSVSFQAQYGSLRILALERGFTIPETSTRAIGALVLGVVLFRLMRDRRPFGFGRMR